MGESALTGLRVLDLTQFEAGPSCTQFLGWLGADIIKIESPAGDQSRKARPWEEKGIDSVFFLLFNSNKRSIAIDLKHPEGRDLFLELVKNADVVIENFAPGLMEKLNLDYPVLRETNPRIIMARLKGFGLDGPYRDYKCFEMIAQAAGGVMAGNGFPDKEPVRLGAGIGDTGTGIHAAAAILAAYIQLQRTGKGQLVECSMQEVITNFLRIRYMDHYRAEAPATRLGNELVGSVPSGVYPCAPGGPNDYVYIYSQPNIPKMWDDLVRAIGRPDLIDDPRCVDATTRYENRQELNPIISNWTRQRDKHEVMRILGEAGIPCSGVFDTADVLNDPHLNARGQIVDVEHAVRGKLKMPGCPVRLSESPAVQAPVPLLGEHTADILAEVLGKSAEDVETLRGRGVVQ